MPSAATELVDTVRPIAHSRAPLARRLAALRDALDRFVSEAPPPDPRAWPHTTGRYVRVLLNDPEDAFQIILVLWPPGARSAIHDHDETDGAVMPVMGTLTETRYAVEGREGERVRLRRTRAVDLVPHTFSAITTEPGEQLHDVVNATTAWAATLHVYLRRIDRFHVFAHEAGDTYRLRTTDLWVDHVRGAEDWRAAPEPAPMATGCRAGHCLCGAVSFEATAPPVAQVVCHCTDCQRATGAAAAPLAFFEVASLHIHGPVQRYVHRNDSGHEVGKESCAGCGTPLFHTSASAPHLRAVYAGVFADPDDFAPTTHLYVGSTPRWQLRNDKRASAVGAGPHAIRRC